MGLTEELLQGLKMLSENDRDLRTLAIFCNPNNPHHAISLGGFPKSVVLKKLEELEKKGIVSRRKKMLSTLDYTQRKIEYELWSLIK